jgi:acylphosphatase
MTLRFRVHGRVQGVGFRHFVARRAAALGVRGHAANLPDGSVEVLAIGEAGALASLEEALRTGPPGSRVIGVDKSEISDEPDGPKSFSTW